MDQQRLDRYKSHEGAASYNVKYEKELHKRINTKREHKVIRKAFACTNPPHATMLDFPMGVARLYPAYKEFVERLHGADVSHEMLKFSRENAAEADPTLAQMSAMHMGYKDRAVPCIFSCRLAHHIRPIDERNQYLAEIMRVADEWIVLTYFNYNSVKNILRRIRAPFNKKKPKITIAPSELKKIADSHGWDVVATFPLSRLFSGHNFTVLKRRK
jgi:ubiquinone/menaquinone biosynthesis C-methylase UbiE